MSNNPNTLAFKQTWADIYELAHYKVPAYKAIADESIRAKLTKGQVFYREYDTDFIVNNMGGDGGYTDQAFTDTQESLTVNFEKETSFYIKDLDIFQSQLPLQIRKAQKAMNAIFLDIDANVFKLAYQGAGSTIDDGSLNGTSGNGITATVGNIQAIFAAGETALRLQNVIYDPTAKFDGKFQLDTMDAMPVSVISAQMYSVLLQYLGAKVTELGDNVSTSGYVGKYFGFNIFCSNNLSWTGSLVLSTNPTEGDTITLLSGVSQNGVSQALTYTFKATPTTAGDVVIASTAAKTVTNLVNALNAPYTTIANATDTGYVPLVQSTLTITQQKLLNYLTASQTNPASASGTTLSLVIAGQGNVPVAETLTPAADIWTAAKQVQHNIMGVNRSIAVVIQKEPNMDILQANPQANSGNSGRVGSDFVTWTAYGIKVFHDQAPMLVDVQVRTDSFTSAPANQA